MRIYFFALLCMPLIIHSKPVGLPNLGNTCYMNSLLQAFLNIPELVYLAKNNLHASETTKLFYAIAASKNTGNLQAALKNFYGHLDTQFELISLSRILDELGQVKTGREREKILEKHTKSETARATSIKNELKDEFISSDRRSDLENRKKRAEQTVRILGVIEGLLKFADIPIETYYSLITAARIKEGDLGYRQQDAEEFYSVFMNSVHIPEVEKFFTIVHQRFIEGSISRESSENNRLSLQLYKQSGSYFTSVQQALDHYCAEDTLDEDYRIPFAKTWLRFVAVPEVLVIQTPRYEQNDYGERLRISPKIAVSDPLIFTQVHHGINARYTPEALVIQSGSLAGGHYVSYIKSYTDGIWYFCNDSSITTLGKKLIPDSSYPYEPNTYLIFYRRIDDPIETASQDLAESLWSLQEVLAQ